MAMTNTEALPFAQGLAADVVDESVDESVDEMAIVGELRRAAR